MVLFCLFWSKHEGFVLHTIDMFKKNLIQYFPKMVWANNIKPTRTNFSQGFTREVFRSSFLWGLPLSSVVFIFKVAIFWQDGLLLCSMMGLVPLAANLSNSCWLKGFGLNQLRGRILYSYLVLLDILDLVHPDWLCDSLWVETGSNS